MHIAHPQLFPAQPCLVAVCTNCLQLYICQYRLLEALALIQQLLADVFEAQNANHRSSMASLSTAATRVGPCGAEAVKIVIAEECTSAPEQQQHQQQHQDVLQLAQRLAATLAGMTADVLFAAARGAGSSSGMAPAAALQLPCIFPTPLCWTRWMRHTADQQAKWELKAGMAVELLPGGILAALPQQLTRHPVADSSDPALLHAVRDAAARASGLLLLSEVLAAKAEGNPLPDDLPELLMQAVADSPLPGSAFNSSWDGGGCGGGSMVAGQCLWQQAAVLACGCSAIVRELQMRTSLADAFDTAAR